MTINDLTIETEERLPEALTEQDRELFSQFASLKKEKNLQVRNRIIEENLKLVFPIAQKFRSSGECLEDLLQVGYIGLIKAVDNFDPDRGVKFVTYASHCISGEIRHYLRDSSSSIKQPRWLRKLSQGVSRFVESFLQKNSRLPAIREIAEGLNISEDGIIEILKAKKPVSLSDVSGNDQERVDYERIKSLKYQTFKLPIEDVIALEEAVEELKNLEKKVIYLFFYQDLTQIQIARNLGLSQKKVSRTLQKSLGKLREDLSEDK
jgi:RNA polymerase sigma-B factor